MCSIRSFIQSSVWRRFLILGCSFTWSIDRANKPVPDPVSPAPISEAVRPCACSAGLGSLGRQGKQRSCRDGTGRRLATRKLVAGRNLRKKVQIVAESRPRKVTDCKAYTARSRTSASSTPAEGRAAELAFLSASDRPLDWMRRYRTSLGRPGMGAWQAASTSTTEDAGAGPGRPHELAPVPRALAVRPGRGAARSPQRRVDPGRAVPEHLHQPRGRRGGRHHRAAGRPAAGLEGLRRRAGRGDRPSDGGRRSTRSGRSTSWRPAWCRTGSCRSARSITPRRRPISTIWPS